VPLHSIGIVSALAAVVLVSARRFSAPALGALAFVFLVVALGVRVPPAAETLAGLVALAAALALAGPRHALAAAACGSALGGLWVCVLRSEGLPPWAAVLAAFVPLAVAAWSARRPTFAAAGLREEALVLVAVLAIVVAVGAEALEGWRAATALRAAPIEEIEIAAAPWTSVVAAVSIGLGAVFALWKGNRR
jgi:hypothetical protein